MIPTGAANSLLLPHEYREALGIVMPNEKKENHQT